MRKVELPLMVIAPAPAIERSLVMPRPEVRVIVPDTLN